MMQVKNKVIVITTLSERAAKYIPKLKCDLLFIDGDNNEEDVR
jgi:hypothetical protein